MNSELLSDLRSVRKVLEVPERWTKGAIARKSNNTPCASYDPAAVCWCISGAVNHVVEGDSERAEDAMAWIAGPTGGSERNVQIWNDMQERKHGEVLARIDAAIDGVVELHVQKLLGPDYMRPSIPPQ